MKSYVFGGLVGANPACARWRIVQADMLAQHSNDDPTVAQKKRRLA